MFDVELHICLYRGQTWPAYKINLDHSQTVLLDENSKIVKYTGTVADMVLLNYLVKEQQETVLEHGEIVRDQVIEIISMWVDQIKISPRMVENLSQYMPRYRPDFLEYCKSANIAVDHGPMHSTKFWHAGQWTFELPANFWYQYQQARQSNEDSDFTGNSKQEIQNSLKRIRSLL